MDSLHHMYDYTVLQEVKESLYFYNEEQISRDIQNYLFAINFESGSIEICNYTGERLEISDELFKSVEGRLLGAAADSGKRLSFRKETQKEYASKTLTQEILLDGKTITETRLYQALYERYIRNLKEKVLDPLLENENFRNAVKDFDTEEFRTYDSAIRRDVTFLMNNLGEKYNYTRQGAKEVCIYVIDNQKFGY